MLQETVKMSLHFPYNRFILLMMAVQFGGDLFPSSVFPFLLSLYVRSSSLVIAIDVGRRSHITQHLSFSFSEEEPVPGGAEADLLALFFESGCKDMDRFLSRLRSSCYWNGTEGIEKRVEWVSRIASLSFIEMYRSRTMGCLISALRFYESLRYMADSSNDESLIRANMYIRIFYCS